MRSRYTPSRGTLRLMAIPLAMLAALATLPLWDMDPIGSRPRNAAVSGMRVLVDPQDTAKPADMAAREGEFKPAAADSLNFGHTRSTVWVMLEASNLQAGPTRLFLALWNPGLDDISLTVRHAGGSVETEVSGDMHTDRPMPWAAGHILPITLEPGEKARLVLRSHTEAGSQLLPVEVLDQDTLEDTNHLKSFIHGLILGICGALFIYNALIYRTLRDSTYGYYSLYVLASMFVIAGLTGMGMTTLWPGNVWLSNEGMLVMGALGKILLVQFSRRFLDTPGLTSLDRVLRGAAWLAAGYLLCALFLPAYHSFRMATVVLFLFPAIALWSGISAWRRGRHQARYFILGQTASWLGLILFGLTALGILPFHRFTFEIVPVSICLDALLLSLALADRLSLLQSQKQEAQEQARRNLEIRREDLERVVRERTVQLALAKDKALSMARTDPLTGAFNRRYMVEIGGREMARSIRLGSPLSVIVLDIDQFKKANDTFGHAQGDLVLRAVALAIMGRIRASDVYFRWGGDEFLLLLPDTPAGEAVALAERLRQAVAGAVTNGPMAGRITASFGVATRADEDPALSRTIARADQALYMAKQNGRNRVEVMVGE